MAEDGKGPGTSSPRRDRVLMFQTGILVAVEMIWDSHDGRARKVFIIESYHDMR